MINLWIESKFSSKWTTNRTTLTLKCESNAHWICFCWQSFTRIQIRWKYFELWLRQQINRCLLQNNAFFSIVLNTRSELRNTWETTETIKTRKTWQRTELVLKVLHWLWIKCYTRRKTYWIGVGLKRFKGERALTRRSLDHRCNDVNAWAELSRAEPNQWQWRLSANQSTRSAQTPPVLAISSAHTSRWQQLSIRCQSIGTETAFSSDGNVPPRLAQVRPALASLGPNRVNKLGHRAHVITCDLAACLHTQRTLRSSRLALFATLITYLMAKHKSSQAHRHWARSRGTDQWIRVSEHWLNRFALELLKHWLNRQKLH